MEHDNIIWLNNNKDHYLYSNWKILHEFSKIYAETSCEITATVLSLKFSGKDFYEWEISNEIDFSHPLSVISMNDEDHFFLIKDGVIYQSYYRKYKLKTEPLKEHHISGIKTKDNDLFFTGTKGKIYQGENVQYIPK